MLRRMVAFDIVAYCENNDEIVNMVAEDLLETLERIKAVCEAAGNEFELRWRGKKTSKAKQNSKHDGSEVDVELYCDRKHFTVY